MALVSEPTVWAHYGEAVRALLDSWEGRAVSYLVPGGDSNKTRAAKAELEDRLLADGWGRDVVILALGGGVVTDLAGFVAATYSRGVRCMSLPTTLLAMVDAALGGKTGVNTEAGKNLVGAFHQPEAVLADIRCLVTLGQAEMDAGLAETAKHALIGDAQLYDWLLAEAKAIKAADQETLTELVIRSASVKLRVVEEDELEVGLRQILNFGHTVGHGLEKASGYRIPHGHAVSIGICVEADAAVRGGLMEPGVRDSVEELLAGLGLPRRIPAGVSLDAVREALKVDKKARRGQVRFAIPAEVGRAATFGGLYTTTLPERALDQALLERS